MSYDLNIKIYNFRIIPIAREQVFSALISELSNLSYWSRPFLKFRGLAPGNSLEIGQKGWMYIFGLGLPKMEIEIVEIVPSRKFKVQYIDGDFLGFGIFELSDFEGGTGVVFSWNATANSKRIDLLSRLLPIRAIHWLVVYLVLRNLENYVDNL